jgi:T5SS/PEP-CTERM-associated repeat protein
MDRLAFGLRLWFTARRFLVSTTLFTTLLVGLCARADTAFWTNFSGGDFNVPGNWFPGVPDFDDAAVFRTLVGNGYVVGVYDPYLVDRLIFGSNVVTLRDAGPSDFGRLTASDPNVNSTTPSLVVGEQSTDVATLNIELFELNAATAKIGVAAGSSGEVNVQGGGLHNLHITGDGSALFDNFIIGERGIGLLSVRDGSHATVVGGARIGQSVGSVGSVTVEGPDSTWDLIPTFNGTANLSIGVAGMGHLGVVNGGTVTNTSAALGGTNGIDDGFGDVLVGGGADSFWINSEDLFVGYIGVGHLTIDTGGHVNSRDGDLGEFAGSRGEVSVAGANAQWNMSRDLRVGVLGSGTLTIAVGGRVNNREARIGEASGASGSVTVSGAGSTWTNQSRMVVGAAGTGMLVVSGGGHVTSGETVIGRDTGSSGAVMVEGSGSSWSVSAGSANIYVGNFGAGTLTVNDGGVVSVSGGMRIGPLGKVNGNGTIMANVINDGKMAPGKSPGILHINGNYEQTASAVLELEIGGNTVGTQYDQLVVAGNATLQGDIVLQMVNGFLPQAGNQFNLLSVSGTFANSADISFTGVAPGWQFSQAFDSLTHMLVVTSLNNAQPLIPGDYNQDGSVDAADYIVWRKGLGTTYTQIDYNTWRSHFGQTLGSGSSGAVPEAAASTLSLLAVCIVGLSSSRPARKPHAEGSFSIESINCRGLS